MSNNNNVNSSSPHNELPTPPGSPPAPAKSASQPISSSTRSSLLRQAFLCNLKDKISLPFIKGSHARHRAVGNGYLPMAGTTSESIKGLDIYEAGEGDDDWVVVDDLSSAKRASGPRDSEGDDIDSPCEHPIDIPRAPPGDGFETQILVGGQGTEIAGTPVKHSVDLQRSVSSFDGKADIKWAPTRDTDLSPAAVGQPDEEKFVMKCYNVDHPKHVKTTKIRRYSIEFDWESEVDVAKLNQARERWIEKILGEVPERVIASSKGAGGNKGGDDFAQTHEPSAVITLPESTAEVAQVTEMLKGLNVGDNKGEDKSIAKDKDEDAGEVQDKKEHGGQEEDVGGVPVEGSYEE